ncbi:inorganic phosphate transporter [Chamaesiphon polymorphus]|uniref:Phosphate transporter n=1 Tax=Chamaesiphon polymorphus CCALA 037 TaxID=2107692 RepID=A0A2T1GEB3_9CYAN|nr:inorganic phosphate transporter [Chamaesiphon polymorphus]PSB55768.1 phosphate permease [Chamaesiphon polymorphus CCALA 037]
MLFIGFVCCLAVYVACNLGANDVANSMGTSVGSKAITLKQAIVIAGILEFTGAVLFGRQVSSTLAISIANPDLFVSQPQTLLLGMIAVLISCGLWLQIATTKNLPVASSHAVVGAIAGFSWVAAGSSAVQWSALGTISLAWVITPLLSAMVAAGFYLVIKRWILERDRPLAQLQQWMPWLSLILVSVFGVIVLPSVVATLPSTFLPEVPRHDFALGLGGMAALAITLVGWRRLAAEKVDLDSITNPQTTEVVERQLARFQLLSACCVAFAHGSNDVGNAIAPLATILYIQSTGTVPQSSLEIPLWVLVLGGVGIVTGLAIWGKQVIATIGEGIIKLEPSSGFAAELATAATILIASSYGLPVSTSHALVGAVVGVGLVKNWQAVRLDTLKSIGLAWVVTIPIATILSAAIFSGLRYFF